MQQGQGALELALQMESALTHDFSKAVKLAVCKVFRKNFVASNSYTKSANTLK
jgi:hypothetical protein